MDAAPWRSRHSIHSEGLGHLVAQGFNYCLETDCSANKDLGDKLHEAAVGWGRTGNVELVLEAWINNPWTAVEAVRRGDAANKPMPQVEVHRRGFVAS